MQVEKQELTSESAAPSARPDLVHPYLPRFAQGVTGILCLEALVFDQPPVVGAALVLILLALVIPRWSPVRAIFRLIAPPAQDLEPAAPVRFAQSIASVGLAVALVLLVTDLTLAGWIVTGVVGAMALFSAITGICVGCAMYRLFLRRATSETDVRSLVGLTGEGPWLVVLTAPGCARCEPVARRVESAADDRAVRIDLARVPAAGRLPVSSVPAVLAVDREGSVLRTATGTVTDDELGALVAATA